MTAYGSLLLLIQLWICAQAIYYDWLTQVSVEFRSLPGTSTHASGREAQTLGLESNALSIWSHVLTMNVSGLMQQ